ncbi:metal ABC transporter permease [Amphibacillus cookii]|uniref:metal ABC transporter permease n=1 Tax=Amphibacillus cookii TaxID=767787 RepID=UPI00195A31E3|nr:metal ABC transporter permease [Amphibacillus cookii]MBM7540448.1 manganese/zinc/iron transport system permease protein [Amphibacillus cookii]
MSYTGWIIITGILVGVTCGINGSLLVLRKTAMLADAISHTVLLGIVGAFFITQTLHGIPMLIGAAVVGLLTAYLVETLNQKGVQKDASIGVIFTSLFALAVVLLSFIGSQVHLDTEHALMGEIAFVPWNRFVLHGIDLGPKAVWMLSTVLLISLTVIFLFYKQIKISTFDHHYAILIGIPVGFIHYLLMTLVSLSTVASFNSVGAILVVAMLIVPGATAYLLSDRFINVILLSGLIGGLSAILGYWSAIQLNVSIAGAMATTTGLFFMLAFLFHREGLVIKYFRHRLRSQ